MPFASGAVTNVLHAHLADFNSISFKGQIWDFDMCCCR